MIAPETARSSVTGAGVTTIASATCSASFDSLQVAATQSDAKLAVVATLDAPDLVHLTLITSLQAKSPSQLMFGQFCEGRSKANLARDPRAGFLVLDAAGRILSGTARWTGDATCGDDYEAYNRKPMFRYNAYSGIHRVHYLDLVSLAPPRRFEVTRAALGTLGLGAARIFIRRRPGPAALTAWARRHLNRVKTIKFAGVVAGDGYPRITAAVPCATVGTDRLVLDTSAFATDTVLESGTPVAVLGLNLDFESVLVHGRISGFRRGVGSRLAVVEIDEVYNSMPFKHGPIYPMPALGLAEHGRYSFEH